MSKPNYVRKAEVIANGDYDMYRYSMQAQVAFFRNKPLRKGNPFRSVKDAIEYHNAKIKENPENAKECERLDNARVHRVMRLKSKIRYMIDNFGCCFVTLTFSDATLQSTSPDTRHQYVRKWLKENFCCGVANVDFGEKNGREHYHAIVPVERVSPASWSYGLIYGKTIPKGDRVNADKLSHYTAKLVNHAIKETTKGCRTIYSGKFGVPLDIPDKSSVETVKVDFDGFIDADVDEIDKLFL